VRRFSAPPSAFPVIMSTFHYTFASSVPFRIVAESGCVTFVNHNIASYFVNRKFHPKERQHHPQKTPSVISLKRAPASLAFIIVVPNLSYCYFPYLNLAALHKHCHQ
jgi:hypothetical protein